MDLTDEQQTIVDYIKNNPDNRKVILANAIAGAGKTTLLQAIADAVPGEGLYISYNKALATEAKRKFPNHIDCRTTHSLAYRAIVPCLKLRVGFFGTRQITEHIQYADKIDLVDNIKEFCLSKYLTYDEFAKEHELKDAILANKYLDLMATSRLECSHDFYLKLFHIYLSEDKIHQVNYNLVLLDEAGDLNEVTLEIFKLLKGKTKVAVGDAYQNIFTFNHTINCFECLKDEGITFNLTQSFRVPDHIAEKVEKFCQTYLKP